ncbi:MAG: hypothetical protein WC989_00820 [Micavibrio sp.]
MTEARITTNIRIETATYNNDAFNNVFLPLPPLDGAEDLKLEIYARFMRHIRLVPHERLENKILSAIQFTADILDMGDVIVAKYLADMGLRAPRAGFPETYLEFVDETLARSGRELGGPCASSVDMRRFWVEIGEENPHPPACAKYGVSGGGVHVPEEGILSRT